MRNQAKVVLLGDSSVGKTSIILQYLKSTFDPQVEPTIGATFVSRIEKTSKEDLELHVWDTAGQERYHSVIPMYLRGASAVIMVCAADSPDSCKNLAMWEDFMRNVIPDIQNIFVVLNKCDLPEAEENDIAEDFAMANGYPFFKTTATTHGSVSALFQAVAEKCSEGAHYAERTFSSEPSAQNQNESSTCC